jgi:hypothetical protein
MAKPGDDSFEHRESKSAANRGNRKPAPKKPRCAARPERNGDRAARGPVNRGESRIGSAKGTKIITSAPDHEEPVPESFGQRKRPENGQFRLKVDRQTKASYPTREAAEEAGLAIKKSYPIVQVVVHDAAEGVHKTIELPSP